MLRAVDGHAPEVAPSAYVDDAAVVISEVVIEAEASVWPNTTLRGDSGRIVLGERSNVQDNGVLHEDAVLEAGVTVGHSAIVHAATVAEGALVGMNSVVLDGATVGRDAVVAAGAVVTEGTEVPPATLMTGVPAEAATTLDHPPSTVPADHYVELATRYEETGERLE